MLSNFVDIRQPGKFSAWLENNYQNFERTLNGRPLLWAFRRKIELFTSVQTTRNNHTHWWTTTSWLTSGWDLRTLTSWKILNADWLKLEITACRAGEFPYLGITWHSRYLHEMSLWRDQCLEFRLIERGEPAAKYLFKLEVIIIVQWCTYNQ